MDHGCGSETWPITMEMFLLDKGVLMCGGVLVWGICVCGSIVFMAE